MWLRVLSHQSASRIAFFSVLTLIAYWGALGRAGGYNDFRDAQYLFTYEYSAVKSVLTYGQLPLWNPYYCGGLYALGSPQDRSASPTLLLSLLFGPARAQVVIAYAMAVLCMEGCFRYLKEHTASSLGPTLTAPLLGLGGFFATAFSNGWIPFYGFGLVPWLLYGIRRTVRLDARGPLLVAVSFSWMLGLGGSYAPLHGALFGAVEVIWALAARRKPIGQLTVRLGWLSATLVLTLCLAAFRLWPLITTMTETPRLMVGAPHNSWNVLYHALFVRTEARASTPLAGAFFFGLFPLPLVALGLQRRALIPAALLALFCLGAAAGYVHGTGPFVWLRELPLFAVTRYPERFLWWTSWYALTLVAGAVGLLLRCGRRRGWARVALLGACGLLAAGHLDALQNHRTILAKMQLSEPPRKENQPFAQARGNRWLAGHWAEINRGSLSCQEAYPLAQSPRLRGDLPREEYLADSTAGTVERTEWSPNRIDLRVTLRRPARVLVNQNWHAGWHSTVGNVVSEDGLLAVDVPSGTHELSLRFFPRSAVGGILTSAVACVSLLAFARRARTKPSPFAPPERRRTLGWLLSPPLVAVLVTLLVREPPALARPLLNANRTPVFVAGLPAGTVPIGVDFGVPVQLVGARLPTNRNTLGIADFELFWRVDGRIARQVGIFVHLEGPNGKLLRADHEVIGQSLLFQDAPRGQLLRDAFSVNLSRQPAGLWRVYVGLWNATGDGRRIAPRPTKSAPPSDGRVFVGTLDVR